MVARMVLPVLLLVFVASTQAKDAKGAKESCDVQNKQIAELTAKLKAVEQQLKKQKASSTRLGHPAESWRIALNRYDTILGCLTHLALDNCR